MSADSPTGESPGRREAGARSSVIRAHEDALVQQLLGAGSADADDPVSSLGTVAAEPNARPLSPSADGDLARGAEIGRYLVLSKLGRGGMGEVYCAYDPELDRRVAVKLLRADAGGSQGSARLVREAQALAKLNHPNVVTVHDVGRADDRVYLAMELVEGQPLGAWLEADRPGWGEVVDVLIRAGTGLAAAHAKGLVHRDFKPDNVMVDRDGRVLVMDFGLARVSERLATPEADVVPDELASASGEVSIDTPLTGTGAVMGTPRFMAPEQWAGLPADARADQFAFCVALYRALLGTWPFAGDTLPALVAAVSTHELQPPVTGTRVPKRLRRAVVRGLSLDPEARWPTMQALLTELARHRQSSWRRWTPLGLLAAVGGGLVLATMASDDTTDPPCLHAGDTVAQHWDADARARLEGAIRSIDVAYAPDIAAKLGADLDVYAKRLSTAYDEACRDTRVEQRQSETLLDRRVACLDRRTRALSIALEVLGRTDADTLGRAHRVFEGLPATAPCADTERLLAALPPPPAEQEEGVARIREDLELAQTLGNAGRADEGLALARRGLRDALALEYPPLVAEATRALADAEASAGNLPAAREQLEAAFFLARSADHDEVAVSVAISLVTLLAQYMHDSDAAEAWARHGEAELAQAATAKQRAEFRTARGTLRLEQGDFDGAEADHAAVLEMVTARHGPDSTAAAVPTNNLASVKMARGDFAEAAEAFARVVEIRLEKLGALHPELASAYSNLGAAQYSAGDNSAAEVSLQRAHEIRREVLRPDHPDLAGTLQNITAVRWAQGDLEGALEAAARTVEILERGLGADAPELITPLSNHSVLLNDAKQGARAEAVAKRALAIADGHPELRASTVAGALANLGTIQNGQERWADALESFTRAISLAESEHGEVHVGLVTKLIGQTEALLNLQRVEDGVAAAERALAVARATQTDSATLGEAHFAVAQAAVMAGRPDDAEVALAAAFDAYSTADPPPASSIDALQAFAKAQGLPVPAPDVRPSESQ